MTPHIRELKNQLLGWIDKGTWFPRWRLERFRRSAGKLAANGNEAGLVDKIHEVRRIIEAGPPKGIAQKAPSAERPCINCLPSYVIHQLPAGVLDRLDTILLRSQWIEEEIKRILNPLRDEQKALTLEFHHLVEHETSPTLSTADGGFAINVHYMRTKYPERYTSTMTDEEVVAKVCETINKANEARQAEMTKGEGKGTHT